MEDTLLLNHAMTWLTVVPPDGFSAPVSVLLAAGDTITVPDVGLFLITEVAVGETWRKGGPPTEYWTYRVKAIGAARWVS